MMWSNWGPPRMRRPGVGGLGLIILLVFIFPPVGIVLLVLYLIQLFTSIKRTDTRRTQTNQTQYRQQSSEPRKTKATVESIYETEAEKSEPESEPAPEPKNVRDPNDFIYEDIRKRFGPSRSENPNVREALEKSVEKLIEIRRIESRIYDPEVRMKIQRIAILIETILEDFIQDPADVKLARTFLNYYLDATLNIIRKYADLSESKVRSKDVENGLKKAESLMDTIAESFEKLIHKFHENDVMEMNVDMEVLEKTLKNEGM